MRRRHCSPGPSAFTPGAGPDPENPMNQATIPTAILDLPDVPARGALRAGLMAMRVLPGALPGERSRRHTALRQLAEDPQTVAFIDISRSGPSTPLTLLQLNAQLPRGEPRKRVFLTRLAGGHVSESDRTWAAALGFAHLYAEFAPDDCEGELRTALDAVASAFLLPPIKPAELRRYTRALDKEQSAGSPRALIRAMTGLSAEAFADLLEHSLDLQDRAFRLQSYPNCFVGSDAVAWIARRYRRSASQAVALGQALGALGLLAHVAHEHPLLNDRLFYRLAVSPAADRLDPAVVWRGLHGDKGVEVADRSYLGKTYPDCWIGSDAVTRLCTQYPLARHDAWVVLHRLMQFGLLEHVAQARPFIDGAFFYRFTGVFASAPSA